MSFLSSSNAFDHRDRNIRRRNARRILEGILAPVLYAAIATSSAPASAEKLDLEDPTHWVFSGALEVSIFGHTGKGNTQGTLLTGPRASDISAIDDLGPSVVGNVASREEVLAALLGGNFEIMSPQLMATAGRPRLFFDFSLTGVLGQETGLARESDPGLFAIPSEAINSGSAVGESAVTGGGTKITVQPQGPQIHAGLGTAFTLEIREEEVIRIKPSLVYSRTILDVDALTHRAVRLNSPGGIVSLDTHFRLIQLSDDFTEVYHGLGPALEIEYEPGIRIGPFGITLYLKGHASYLFGDLTTKLSGVNPDPNSPGESVSWKYTQDAWAYRAGTGIRLRWDPLRGR